MVEKYKGVIPPGSIWYSLNREESLALLSHRGELDKMSPEQIASVDSSDIQAVKGKTKELENMLIQAGLSIITLYD
jgi:hypothetical protein